MKKRDHEVFTSPVALRVIVAAVLALCVAGFALQLAAAFAAWDPLLFSGFAGLLVMGVLVTVQTFRARVELRPDEILVVGLLKRTRYARSDVVAAQWSRGRPVTLALRDGTRARLPHTGHPNNEVAGAIRAWLHETAARDAAGQADVRAVTTRTEAASETRT